MVLTEVGNIIEPVLGINSNWKQFGILFKTHGRDERDAEESVSS
jgi:hypothetical protein